MIESNVLAADRADAIRQIDSHAKAGYTRASRAVAILASVVTVSLLIAFGAWVMNQMRATDEPSRARPSSPYRRTFTIGQSVQGRPLVVHQLGDGPIKRALIGAIHGGYEWNTALLMTRTLEFLLDNPDELPADITLFILPIANPDGYAAGRDSVRGRTNANRVDLNRNWDYKWRANAFFGRRPISGGSAPFSEPETVAMRDFIVNNGISESIFYHSSYPAVFSGAGIARTETVALAKHIADATGYPYRPDGIPGQITTGDAIDWLTTQGINAIEIELTTHTDIDWEQNLRGLRAFLNWKARGRVD